MVMASRSHKFVLTFDGHCRWFSFDSNCVIPRDEFSKACKRLKESCAKEGEQREWYSYELKHRDWLRHKRLPYAPQDTLKSDVLESQKIGCGPLHAVDGNNCP
jgi:ribosomal protein S21